jgi:ribonuclease BN (tRNA processing enzyme)
MSLKVTVLGSGTIIPEPDRMASGIFFDAGGTEGLIDCGPGVLQRFQATGADFRTIRRIFLSHYHPDHTLALPRLFSAMKNSEMEDGVPTITIYGPEGLFGFIEGIEKLYHGITSGVELKIVELKGPGQVGVEGARVRFAPVSHGGTSALAFRVEHGTTSFTYTGDAGFSESLVELATGTDLLISECSFPDYSPADGHLTPALAGAIVSKAGAGAILLVHIYPFTSRNEIAEQVRAVCDIPVEIAEDMKVFEL